MVVFLKTDVPVAALLAGRLRVASEFDDETLTVR